MVVEEQTRQEEVNQKLKEALDEKDHLSTELEL